MEIEGEKEKVSLAEYLILLDIYKEQIKEEIISSSLAVKINADVTSLIFQRVYKKLIEFKIFKYIKKVGVSTLYKIDYKKLDDFIRQNYIYQRTKEFVIKADPLMHEI